MKDFLKENDIIAESKSVLKRDNLAEFVDGIIEKGKRKKYKKISQMDDIVRGRVNTKSWEDVEKIFNELYKGKKYRVIHKENPRRPLANKNEYGYPRYHIILEDPKTGLTHEWQIGTKAVTEVYEKEGIKIPEGLKLKKGMHNDLHDIEYDIFKKVQDSNFKLANKIGITEFMKKVDNLAGKAGRLGDAYSKPELYKEIEILHKDASIILKKMYKIKGAKYIEKFYH